jgi:hypothetical protein
MTVEQRLGALEKQVAELKQRLDIGEAGATWLERVAGSFQGDADFLEILRLGREIRQADRPPDDLQAE